MKRSRYTAALAGAAILASVAGGEPTTAQSASPLAGADVAVLEQLCHTNTATDLELSVCLTVVHDILAPGSDAVAGSPEPAPTAATASVDTFGDGTFVVPDEVRPGTYKGRSEGTCYWQRLSGFSGDDTIENDFVASTGPVIVTIKKSDAGFDSSDCGPWVRIGN